MSGQPHGDGRREWASIAAFASNVFALISLPLAAYFWTIGPYESLLAAVLTALAAFGSGLVGIIARRNVWIVATPGIVIGGLIAALSILAHEFLYEFASQFGG